MGLLVGGVQLASASCVCEFAVVAGCVSLCSKLSSAAVDLCLEEK